jgi:hypothetical protein
MLSELLKSFGALDSEDQESITEAAIESTKNMKWLPNPGPQTEAYFTEADELFYGGSAGGGKSALINGLAINEHGRSLILRQFRDDAKKLAEAELIGMILNGNKDGWNGSDLIYRGSNYIQYGGCDHEDDKQRFKGDPHDLICVGFGTPVLMADGSYKAINELVSGDMLQTLEGPKPLERVYRRQRKPCVKISVYDSHGVVIAEQIQSTTHDVMTNHGWTSAASLGAVCEPIQCRDACTLSGWLLPRYESLLRHLSGSIYYLARMVGLYWRLPPNRFCLVESAFCQQEDSHGVASVSYECSQDVRRPPLLFGHLKRLTRHLLHKFSFLIRSSLSREETCAQNSLKLQDFLKRYSFCIRQYGARTQRFLSSLIGLEVVQQCLLQLVDVAQPTPSHLQGGDAGDTQRCNRLRGTYLHPYTKEKRLIHESCSLLDAAFEVSSVGVCDVYDIQVNEVNHYITKGGFINKNCFDEVTDFSETQYRFICIWNRSAKPDQRCRIVATGNPPTTAAGLWVVRRWAAWLDPNHSNPAKAGELRWYVVGPNDEDIEVDNIGPHEFEWSPKPIMARSRTFIPAKLQDNPDLMDDGHYETMLDSLPKDLRDAYRDGQFKIVLEDNPKQLIPASWVKAAQDRWTDAPPDGVPMCSIGVDVAQGGKDENVLAPRYDGWYAPLKKIPGKDTPLGTDLLGPIMSIRRDNAKIILDVGGGYGSDTYKACIDNSIPVTPHKGAKGSHKKSECGLYGFANYRAEVYYRFKEALNPARPGGSRIALPPDTTLFADLTAILFTVEKSPQGLMIKLEPKDKLCSRIGRSPDCGDPVVNAWSDGDKIENSYSTWENNRTSGRMKQTVAIMSNRRKRRF